MCHERLVITTRTFRDTLQKPGRDPTEEPVIDEVIAQLRKANWTPSNRIELKLVINHRRHADQGSGSLDSQATHGFPFSSIESPSRCRWTLIRRLVTAGD